MAAFWSRQNQWRGVRQRPRPRDLAVYDDVPIGGTPYRDDRHLHAAPELFGNGLRWGDSDDDLEQWREEFPDLWARYEMDCGRVSGKVEVTGAPVPFQQQPRFSADVEDTVASILQDLLDDGVVVEGISPSNSPLQPIRKADGKSWRLTLNCRAVNKATPVTVAPVILDRSKLVSTLSPKSKYFSVVDLSNSSFAIPLAAGSMARFAFTFWDQQYLFARLPQGFHSTTSIVHQRVAQMLFQLDQGDKPWVLSYVDDILVAGKNQKTTKARTRRVLKLIQETGFKAKLEKAQLVRPKVDYLGMTIGAEGREIQASKLEAICRAPCPRDVHSLRSLLGQLGSLQDHIAGYWELAWPLHRLTTEQTGWEWGPEQDEALNNLKCAVLAAPTLRFPDKSQPFVIRLMIGKEAVGAALLQEDERGRLVPVGHSSRILKDREVSYVPQEKECLAAIWAVQAFETLVGPAPILIQMPHSPWKYLLRGNPLGSGGTSPHVAQWTLLLVKKGVTARGSQPKRGHPPGSLVPTAPPLQQLPSHFPKANVWFTASEKVCSIGFAAANLEEQWLLGVAEGSSVLGAELVALRELLRHHRYPSPLCLYTSCWSLVERLQSQIEEWGWEPWARSSQGLWSSILQWVHANPGVLHIRDVGWDGCEDPKQWEWSQKVGRRARAMAGRAAGSRQIWEPSKHEKQEIIAQCHSWLHEGVERTLARVRQVAGWEGDGREVARWVQNCLKCVAGRDGADGVLVQRAEGPWAQLQLGYISGLPEAKEGHRSLLVVEDEFSGWVEAFPLQEATAEEMAEALYREVFTRYGTPRAIRLPNVPRVLRHAVVKAASDVEVPWDILQSGQVASSTATLQRLARGAGKEWVKMLPLILTGIRSIQARKAMLSPYQIIFGFPLEVRRGCEEDVCSQGNILLQLCRLQEDGVLYKHRTQAALRRGCLEGDAP